MAPSLETAALEQPGKIQRLTLYAEPGAPAIARFDVDELPGRLPKILIWSDRIYVAAGDGNYFETAPVVIDVHTRPADPQPRAALILQPQQPRPID